MSVLENVLSVKVSTMQKNEIQLAVEEFKKEFMKTDEFLEMMRATSKDILSEEEPLEPWKMSAVYKDRILAMFFKDMIDTISQELRDVDSDLDHYYKALVDAGNSNKKEWILWTINNTKEYRKVLQKRLICCEIRLDITTGKNRHKESVLDISRAKAVPLSEIIGSLGEGNKDRRKFCCPMHKEKTPSFVWYVKENRAKCFGCGWWGDAIDLYMLINNTDFRSAVNALNKF